MKLVEPYKNCWTFPKKSRIVFCANKLPMKRQLSWCRRIFQLRDRRLR